MNPDSETTAAWISVAETPVDAYVPLPPPQRVPHRRPPVRLLVAMVLILLAGLGFSGLAALDQLDAQRHYDSTVAGHATAAAELTATREQLIRAASRGSTALTAANDTVAVAVDGYVGATEKAALIETGAALAAALAKSEAHLDGPLDIRRLGENPWTVPGLKAETARLEAEIAALGIDAENSRTMTTAIADAEAATADAGDAVVLSVVPLAEALTATYYSATNDTNIRFSATVDRLVLLDGSWGPLVSHAISDYIAAAGQLSESHAAEEAEKAGRLYATRVAIEAYARSIAGGVRLDFDWADVVNGHGANDNRYSGTATWNLSNGGYSTISLSNNIAANWFIDPAVTRGLVTHEVGHSITSKCHPVFVASFDSDNEVWATAWAMGMGHSAANSGAELYGVPSNELVELSKQCR